MSVNRNIFYTFLTQIPALVFGVASGIFITRLVGAQGVGTFALMQNDLELFALLLSFSLNSAIVYYVANKKIPEEILSGISVLFLGGGMLLMLFVIPGLYFFDKGGLFIPETGSRLLYALFILSGFFLNVANALISAFFQGRSNFRIVNMMQLINSIFNFICYGSAFIAWKFFNVTITIDHILLIALSVLFVNSILWTFFYIRHFGIHIRFSFSFAKYLRPLSVFIFTAHISHIVNFLNYRLDVWVVNHYNTMAAVGFYSRAAGIAQMFWLISNPISNVLVPYITNPEHRDRDNVFAFFSKFNATAVLLLSVLAASLAGWLFPLVYGSEFSASVLPFRILLPAIWFSCVNKIFAVYIYSRGKVKYNLYTTIVGLVVTVALDLILIPRFGITGASWATFFTYLSILLATLVFAFGTLKLKAGNYFLLSVNDIRTMNEKLRSFFK